MMEQLRKNKTKQKKNSSVKGTDWLKYKVTCGRKREIGIKRNKCTDVQNVTEVYGGFLQTEMYEFEGGGDTIWNRWGV